MPASRFVLRLVVVVGLAALPTALASTAAQASTTWSNTTPISIPAGQPSTTSGPATPYPSTISVAGMGGALGDVDVTLAGLNHTFEADIDVLLVDPIGEAVEVMSDVGGGGGFVNTTLTLSDGAPALPSTTTNIASGTYAPTDAGPSDTYPAPAPAEPYENNLGAFNGIDPNGTWSLYVVDDGSGDVGTMSGGWSITLSMQPALSVSDISVTEGDSGTTYATFTVSEGFGSAQTITVNYATHAGTATAGVDYQDRSGTLTFSPGTHYRKVNVPIIGDLTYEPNETFSIELSNATNAPILDGTAIATIVNNDPYPTAYVSDASAIEGNSGTQALVFTLSLSNPSSAYVTLDYATADGTAKAGSDYTARSGSKVFQPGQTIKSITVPVIGETVQEPDETLFVTLYDPDNVDLADGQGLGTIIDDDRPQITINDPVITEANSGSTKAIVFTISLDHAATASITVSYATADGTAAAPGDYTAKTGTVTFSVGQTSKTVSVTTKGDNTVEPDEYFYLNLSYTGTAAILTDDQGQGTILNND